MTGNKITIEDLDHFNEAQIKSRYLKLIDQYGADNVRICNVISAAVKVDVDLNL